MQVETPQDLYRLIATLQRRDAFPHPVRYFQTIETHISIVLLTGDYAYKFKKPVNFGFLDFSTRDKRQFYARREVQINRRLAPDIYLDVVDVGGEPPTVHGQPAIEPAVWMNEFRQEDIFLNRIQQPAGLTLKQFKRLGIHVGLFHLQAPQAVPESRFGSEQVVRHYVFQNFYQIRTHWASDEPLPALVTEIEHWTQQQHQALQDLIRHRKAQGFVRHCHGDMHLKNIVEFKGKTQVFDAIEFNDELAWIDWMNEIAFLLMDLDYWQGRPFGWNFLNWWLAYTGDYIGLRLLNYYRTYRAMVRAKVSLFQKNKDDFERYLRLAHRYTQWQPQPHLVIVMGVSGSGKSTIAEQLAAHGAMVWVRSDVERKRIAGLLPHEKSTHKNIYTTEYNVRTYQRLRELASQLLDLGFPVLVDATFLKKEHRLPFVHLAREKGVPLTIVHITADAETCAQRIQQRLRQQWEPSEATPEVLQRQLAALQPPETDEGHVITVCTDQPLSEEQIRDLLSRSSASRPVAQDLVQDVQ